MAKRHVSVTCQYDVGFCAWVINEHSPDTISTKMNLIFFIVVVLSALVAPLHAFSQFLVAKLLRVPVEAMIVGVGPRLFPKHETSTARIQVFLVPIWSWVRFAPLSEKRRIGTAARQIVSRLCGPVFVYLIVAVPLFLTALHSWPRTVYSSPPEVEMVVPQSPAEASGLRPGDIIHKADGRSVQDIRELGKIVQSSNGKTLVLDIERSGQSDQVSIVPQSVRALDISGDVQERYRIGMTAVSRRTEEPLTIGEAASTAITEPVRRLIAYVHLFFYGMRTTANRIQQDAPTTVEGPLMVVDISGGYGPSGLAMVFLVPAITFIVIGLTISDLIRFIVGMRNKN